MNNKVKPAVIGGIVLGLLSAIPFIDSCCCVWAILGGMLASYIYVKNSPTPVNAGDGAIVGALAAVVGVAISLVVGIPLAIVAAPTIKGMFEGMLVNVDPSMREMFRQQLEASGSVASAIQSGLIKAVLLFMFSIIGGLIGIPLFEKRKGGPPPPPPAPGGAPYAA